MYLNRRKWGLKLYLILSGIFIASLVTCNLIFQKFFFWTPFSFLLTQGVDITDIILAVQNKVPHNIIVEMKNNLFSQVPSGFFNSIIPQSIIATLGGFTFEISAGILPYPVTFLVTDIISEIYGRTKANQVVVSGFIASIFIMLITSIAQAVPATSWSPINDETFTTVFGLYGSAVFASMTAYIMAQFIDIRMFHFWKKVTKGKHLWLRNNGSTIFSQLIDTSAVLILLCSFEIIDWTKFNTLLINGFLFKVFVALIDTPLFYLISWYLKKSFG